MTDTSVGVTQQSLMFHWKKTASSSGPVLCEEFFIIIHSKFSYVFVYLRLHWVSVTVSRLSLVAVRGATLCCGARACHCSSFSRCGSGLQGPGLHLWCKGLSLQRRLSPWSAGSRGLGFSGCSARAQWLWYMDSVAPRPVESFQIEPVTPTLAGRFLSTLPPGKPWPTAL